MRRTLTIWRPNWGYKFSLGLLAVLATVARGQATREELQAPPSELVVLAVPTSLTADGKPQVSVIWSIDPAAKRYEVFETANASKFAFASSATAGGKVLVEASAIDWDARRFSKKLWIVTSAGKPVDPVDPVDPVNPIVVPPSVTDNYGVGHASYRAAAAVVDPQRGQHALAIASAWRQAAGSLVTQSDTLEGVWRKAWGQIDSSSGNALGAWKPWRAIVIEKIGKQVRTTREWVGLFDEIAGSLEVIK